MHATDQTIAITGATGSIGSFCPVPFASLKTRLEDSVDARVAEIEKLTPRPQVLFHLAAMVDPNECESNPDRAYLLNVEGALRWFEAARQVGISRFIFISTSHVYTPTAIGQNIGIDTPPNPRSIYGKTKLAAEVALAAATLVPGKTPPPRLVIARIFSVLSPLRRPGFLLTNLHRRAAERDFSPIPGLQNVRDFLTPHEIWAQLLKLGRMPSPPKTALICSGKGTPIREVVYQVFSEYGLGEESRKIATSSEGDANSLVGERCLQLFEED